MKPLIAIVGPTAIGKTELALHLAGHFDIEVVGADSRQVYRYMNIGTAKPTRKERARVPHHLVDIIPPNEPFSLAVYEALAHEVIQDIHQRDKLPLLVGGSGLYLWAVMEGWKIPQVPPDNEFRRDMEERAQIKGKESLHAELRELDPTSAEKIDPRNVRRVIRAMEVTKATGIPFSQLQRKEPPPFHTLVIGLTTNRDSLYQRIDERVEQMVRRGLVEEVQRLFERGYGPSLTPMSSMGYRQIGKYLQGEMELSAAIEETKVETHRFARQQYTWFRLKDARIHWFDTANDNEEPIRQLVAMARAGR
jgi:tRNA dimethylallyltransferase